MTTNYNGSAIGVPYVRAHRVTINYPDGGAMPTATIEQSEAVKVLDGTVRKLADLPAITCILDFGNGNDPIPLINPENGADFGADTSLNQAFMCVLAVVRKAQKDADV